MRIINRSYYLFSGPSVFFKAHLAGVNQVPRYVTNVATRSRSKFHIEYLKSAIERKVNDWAEVKSNILNNKDGSITEKNIDAIVIKYITAQKQFDAAHSFIEYLQNSGRELNLGVTNSLLNMYYALSKENPLPEEAKKFILDCHKSLYDKYKVLDYFTSERLLHALCSIDEWKKCLKIIDDIKISSTPSHSAYSILIATLFKNNEKAEAIQMIQRSLNDNRPILEYAYDEWFEYILRKYKDKKTIPKYLDEVCTYLAVNYIKVPEATAKRIQEIYEALGWSAKYTTVNRNSGLCTCCNNFLNDITFSDEDFSLLHQNVKEKLIVGSDLFLKTSPQELERFSTFINRTGPYDVVLDGLNIAYTIGKSSPIEKMKALNFVVDYFKTRNKKILLLGRKHMYKWHESTLKELSQKTFSFFTENMSQDDPYFITAAILSGAHTDIVSRDLLRGHRFLMKNEQLRLLFQRWQWKHQWMLFTIRKKPVLQAPLNFTPCAQKNDCGWHIPYERIVETGMNYLNNGDPDCSAWLCIREKQTQ